MKNSVVAVHYKVKPESIEEFIELLKENAINTLEEPGCLNYEASIDNYEVFLYEKYKTKEDVEFHKSRSYYKEYVEKSNEMLVEKIVKVYTAI